jgi:hypothetical protein
VIVECPNCGEGVVVNGLGRKPLNVAVKNVCDALRDSTTVSGAASKLGCSRGYIYKVLAEHGMKPKDVIARGDLSEGVHSVKDCWERQSVLGAARCARARCGMTMDAPSRA